MIKIIDGEFKERVKNRNKHSILLDAKELSGFPVLMDMMEMKYNLYKSDSETWLELAPDDLIRFLMLLIVWKGPSSKEYSRIS